MMVRRLSGKVAESEVRPRRRSAARKAAAAAVVILLLSACPAPLTAGAAAAGASRSQAGTTAQTQTAAQARKTSSARSKSGKTSKARSKSGKTSSGKTNTSAGSASSVVTGVSAASTSGPVTVSLGAMDQNARAEEESAFFQVLNNNPVQVLNYGTQSSGFRWMSMAGGQETASCWSLTFQAAQGTAADGSSVCQVQFPLQTAMGGRSLLSGESLQAVYDDGSGLFYELTTVVSGGVAAVSVPYLVKTGAVPKLLFVITSGWWAPSASSYDYLAIGNSITLHPRMSYWPDAMGMGASRITSDYYHLTAANLQTQCAASGKAFSTAAMNYAIWEVASGNRSQYLYLLDPYLTPSLDLVSIQLGENAMTDDAGFAADFPALIQYIRGKAPKAEIVIVGNFWKDAVQEQVKIQTAAANGCRYADLSQAAITVYPGAVGSPSAYTYNYGTVYDADGRGSVSSEPAVNLHPNDAGMSFIANVILQTAGPVS